MTAVYDPARQCQGKIRYLTRAYARKAARRLARRPGCGAARMQAYRCPHCGLWHVGHAAR